MRAEEAAKYRKEMDAFQTKLENEHKDRLLKLTEQQTHLTSEIKRREEVRVFNSFVY